jgi:hypothetical protein
VVGDPLLFLRLEERVGGVVECALLVVPTNGSTKLSLRKLERELRRQFHNQGQCCRSLKGCCWPDRHLTAGQGWDEKPRK